MEKKNNIIPCMFATGLEVKGQVFESPDLDCIVEYETVDVVKKTGEKDTDFVVFQEVRESARYNRRDFINSNSDEVGILNIIKKVQMTGDNDLLNQRKTASLPVSQTIGGRDLQEIYDTTNLPSSKATASDIVTAGVHAFDNLPEDMKNKMSMADFVNAFGAEQLQAYLDAKKTTEGGAE